MADPVNIGPVNNGHLPQPVGPFKVIVVGDPGVGKTWYVHRAVKGTSPESIIPSTTLTVGAYEMKVLISPKVEVTLEIWDTAGQERFNSLSDQYYRGAAAVLAVYDADHKYSIGDILRDISFHMFDDGDRNYSLHKGNSAYTPLVFLLATKTDLFSSSRRTTIQRPNTPRPEARKSASSSSSAAAAAAAAWPKELAFSDNEIQTLSEKYGVLISGRFCVSSKSGENVEETVRGIAELIVNSRSCEIRTDDDNSCKQTIQLHSPKERHAKKCAC